ncbi:ABC transporter six-transmembrane domain-containing protein [Glaesserella parasuis]|nr:ABC transporter six-transmembrane domain-containing protein [Glaesserella parasuis]
MFRSLKTLALQHKKRLFATFGLVAAENLLLLIYPLVGSFAVNAVLNGQLVSALAYALIVLIIWGKLGVTNFPSKSIYPIGQIVYDPPVFNPILR